MGRSGRSKSNKRTSSQRSFSPIRQPKELNVFRAQMETYSGPVPHPETLERFEQTHPGAAKLIFTAFEEQGNHRRSIESKVVDANIAAAKRGQLFGLILSLVIVIGSLFLIYEGRASVGAALIISDLLAFAAVFLVGRREQTREREERVKMLTKLAKQ